MVSKHDFKQVHILSVHVSFWSLISWQNGLDCRLIAVSITRYILMHGLDKYLDSIPGNQSPYMKCPHVIWRQLFECVSTNHFHCHCWWCELKDEETWLEEPSQLVLDIIHNSGLDQSNKMKALSIILARSRDRCKKCNIYPSEVGFNDSNVSDSPEVSNQKEDLTMNWLSSHIKRLMYNEAQSSWLYTCKT